MKGIVKGMSKLGLMLLIGIALYPVGYMLIHSLKGEAFIRTLYEANNVSVWDKVFIRPFYINLDQYYRVFFATPEFLYMFWNAFIIVFPIVLFQVLLGILAAYGFSKLKFIGSGTLFFIYIIVMLMPFQVTLLPNYIILEKLRLLDSYLALILPGIFSTTSIFFLKQFMEGIDKAYIEEARLLGAGEFQIAFWIIAPMCKPVIGPVCVLLWIDYWSMVEQPLIFITSKEKYPLSVYLSTLANSNIGIGFACSVIYMALPILLVLYIQNDFEEGLRMTSLK